MNDVCFLLDDYKFNYRVGAIVIKEGKILLHKSKDDDFYAFPGGRVKVGESSLEALKREFEEEIGEQIVVKDFAGMVENFFEYNQKKYHELMLVFNVDFVNKELYDVSKIKGLEENGKIEFVWKNINEFEKMDIRPVFLKQKLLENDDIGHIVNKKYSN